MQTNCFSDENSEDGNDTKELNIEAVKVGLRMSIGKTKIMYPIKSVYLESLEIQNYNFVDKIEYLGKLLNEYVGLTLGITQGMSSG